MNPNCDLLIVGAGPAGLSAAINGASEGLKVILIDSGPKTGGQAVNSSLIENYAGFPDGITGEELMGAFIAQAAKFNTDIRCPENAIGISDNGICREITTETGDVITARTVILAGGLSYNRLNAKNLGRLLGRGVLYGAPTFDPTSMGDCQICIVGGANSAGQAAMHMSLNPSAHIKMLVRRGIESQMSEYLIERIMACPNIEVVNGVEVVSVEGQKKLEDVVVKKIADGTEEKIPANHMFIFIGASPKTQWLKGKVAFDERNFILTDGLLLKHDLWETKERLPFTCETSMPGVFACGDVRLGSTKRIAGAVGDGAMALQMCHEFLKLGVPH